MRTLLVCILLLLIADAVDAQMKIPNISVRDLEQKYPDTLSTGVLVLIDNTEMEDLSEKITFKRHVRMKVTNKEKFLWSNSLPSLRALINNENLNRFKAWSYSLDNGKMVKTKISKDAILNGTTSSMTYETGSIIEYVYLTASPYVSEMISSPVVSMDPLGDIERRTMKRYNYGFYFPGYRQPPSPSARCCNFVK
jgi:hypothetical protein